MHSSLNPLLSLTRRIVLFAAAWSALGSLQAQSTGTALVRHAPSINAGSVDGSLQQMTAESVVLNGGGVVTGDLLVPGTPNVVLNGNPTYGGTLNGTGAATPTNYQVTINGNVTLRHVIRRTNAVALPAVTAPPQPAGTRTVTINSASQSPGNFATLRHLTLNGNVGQFAIPPGTYGNFTANGGAGFTLGVAGATQPSVYNFQNLTLNGQTQVQVLGPVIVTVANGFTGNGAMGSSANSARLTLNIYSGGFTLNGGCNLYGYVNAPNGTVIVNGNSQLIGGVTCDRLIVNGAGLLRLLAAASGNQAPVANNGAVALNEDTPASVTLSATDANGNPLTYAVVAAPAHGALSGTAPNLTYTPALNYHGADSFTFKANDGQADSNVATVSLTIAPVNDRPNADAKSVTTAEDTSANVILSGTDVDGNTLTFSIASSPAHGALSGASPNLIYTPAANYHGTDSFTYVANDGSLNSTPATVSITVTPVNDTPVANSAGYSVNEGATVAIVLTGSDVDGNPLTFTVLSQPTRGTLSGSAPNLSYQPNANFSALDSFTFRVNDGSINSAPATITIQVSNLNDPPVANDQSVTTAEDTTKAITLSGSDPDGDAIAYVVVTPPQHGALTGSAPNLTYTPAANYHGPDSFTFKTRDTSLVDSNLATVSITVTPVNDAPVADDQAIATDEDTAVAIQLTGSDVESSPLTFALVTPPQHGTLTGTAPNLSYTPAANYHGADSLTFKVNDGLLDSAVATVTLTVRTVNDAPIATQQTVTTPEDTTLAVTLAGTDGEGDALTFTVATPPAHGTLAGTAPNLSYTPAPDYYGPDSFTFTANDGALDSAPATVAITVTPVNDAPVATNQPFTQAQDTPVTFTLAATDVDGDVLTYTVITPPAHGTLTGTLPNLTYTPAFNFRGTDSITFAVSDGQLSSNQATVTFTMTPVSHAPVAANQSVTLPEDTPTAVVLSASDLDGNALTYLVVTPPVHGTLSGTAPNLTYTPALNYHGPDSFTFKANDGQADSNVATVSLTVEPLNDAPVAAAQAITLAEDTPTPVTLAATDVDSPSFTYAVVTLPQHGMLSGTAPSLTYTPAANYHGPDSFTFKANDGFADSTVATISLTITPVNDAPVADAKSVTLPEDGSASIALTGSDLDGNPITFSVVASPQHGALSGTAPNLTYTPALNFNGADSFTFKVNDGQADSNVATVSLNVESVNDAPIANAATYSVNENGTLAITLTGSDVDGDSLAFTTLTSPTHGTLTGTAPNLSYHPSANFGGTDSFTFRASDGTLNSAAATITIQVTNLNDPPLANDQSVATLEDTAAAITLTGSDPDGDAITFQVVTPPTHGTLTGAAPNLSYTPALNYNGPDSFTFRPRDPANVDSNLATVSITVTPVNDAPVAADQAVALDEDTPTAIVLTGSDIDSPTLNFTVVASPQHGLLSGTAPNLTYTPAPNYHGPDSFTFKASDGSLDSAPATVSITVRPVNDAPVATAQTLTTPEDTALAITLAGTDVEGSALTFAVVTQPTHGVLTGTAPSLTYTPAANYNGPDSFTFKANDGGLDSLPATVAITVTPVNDAPVASNQSVTTAEDVAAAITLTGSDPDGDAVTFHVVTPPAHGTLSGTGPDLTYTPAPDYDGPDSFTFRTRDPANVDSSNLGTVSITVTPVNDAPVAVAQAVALDEDTPASIVLTATDVDSLTLAFSVVALPQHGTLSGTASNLTYTPALNYNGPDSFTFKANDGALDSSPATVAITVRPINDAPVAAAQSATLEEDVPTAIVLGVTDVDGDALTYTIVTPPAHGALSGAAPNLTYTPVANYSGTDSFSYKASDGTLDSSVTTVSLTITVVNDAPVATAQTRTTAEDTSVALTLAGTDVDSPALTFAIVTPPQHGTLSGTAPNFSYKPAPDYYGADSFTFKANDGLLDSAPATVALTITPVNDAPVVDAQTISTSSGAPTSIVLTGLDVDSPTLTFAVVNEPTHGARTGTPPNVTYTSNASFGGFDSFTFVASDGELTSAPATIQIISGLPPRSRLYTTTADFTGPNGTLTALSTDVPDQLTNKTVMSSFDVVWIANSSKGTVLKLDPDTGRPLGEYLTTPEGVASPYPSRVAVDSKGNAWIANYSHDSIVKIGQPENGHTIDRNHNGTVETSGSLGDIKPWPGADLTTAGDEAILLYVRTEFLGVRHISIDADDNVWVGGMSGSWQKFDGKTGALLRTEPTIGVGGLGGFIAGDGKLYSAGSRFLIWNTNNPIADLPQGGSIRGDTWAAALDSKGNLWTTKDGVSTVAVYSPAGALIGEYYHGEPWAMGIAIDANDHVWIAHSHCGHTVGHLLPDGRLVGNVEVANHGPVEVSIDRHGRIWVASSTGVVERINPLGGAIGSDGVTPIGEVDVKSGNLGGTLWTYGRFTGSSFGLSTPDGLWTATYDGLLAGTTWGPAVWSGLISNDAQIQVEAALSADGTTFGPFQPLTLSNPTPSGAGRYLKTRVRLVSAKTGETPVLHDLTVGTAGYTPPVTTPTWYVSAGADIAGNWPDAILLKGAFNHSVHAFPTEPTYAWSVVSGPGTVTFTNATLKRPSAQFSAQGTYVLRVTATLGAETSTDTVNVVLTPYNRAPYANAGYTTFLATFPPQIWLWGEVRDDGLPVAAPVTSTWSKMFGPGTVTFANPASPSTTAVFSAPGVYTLKLSATDTELTTDNTTNVWIGVPPPPPVPDGLVSWWEASGNGDDHISGNQAFPERGADYFDGKLGGAFRFDGANDRVRVFSSPGLNTGAKDGITVELWVNPSVQRVATMFQYGLNATSRGFQIRQINRQVEVNFREANGTDHLLTTGNVLTVGAWTHLTASYDRTTGEARIFADGILQLSQTIGSFVVGTNFDIFMGGRADSIEPYQGLLDEISVYNRAIFADQVTTIFTVGKRPPVSNLPPVASAGPDLYNRHVNTAVPLAGTVTDDGQPLNGALTVTWSKLSGPGSVTFTNANLAQTNATFSAAGIYVLQLRGDDGAFYADDTVEVRVDVLGTFETDASLAAWWPANASDVDAAHGIKLERFHGMAFDPAGESEQAFALDGVNEYGRAKASSTLDLGASAAGLTVELWVKPARAQTVPLVQWNNNAGTEGVGVWQQNVGGTGVNVALTDSSGTGHDIGINADVLPRNAWTHLAVTYDKTTGIARIYLNGVIANEQPMGVFTPRTNLPLVVGARVGDARYYQGSLDEISLYNRPLAYAEVNAIYQAGIVGKNPIDGNQAPVVAGGADVQIANAAGIATLAGTASDDGKPAGTPVTATWTKLDGPGAVTFGNPGAASTTATFSAPGTYVLRLDANDSFKQRAGDTIVVRAGVLGTFETDSSLAAWWPGNGDPRDMAHGHDVELLQGMGYGLGKVSQAFALDGVNDHGRVPAHADFNIGTSAAGLTIELWVNPSRTQFAPLLQWNNNLGVEGVGVWQQNNGNTGVNVALTDTSGTGHDIGINADVLPRNAWTHVAATYDRVTGMGRVYINGVIMTELNMGIFTPRTNLPLVIGARVADSRFFQGGLDEIGLYTRPLSLAEISAIYQTGATGKNPIDGNLPPVVNAGPDVQLLNASGSAVLNGSVIDVGTPPGGVLTVAWSKVDGPGSVTFANGSVAATTATFSAPGTYVLRLDAHDSFKQGVADTVTVRVAMVGTVEADASLAAWWPANGDPQEMVRGNHDVEFYNGMGYGVGKVSQAFALDGVNDHGRVPAHADLNPGASAAGLTVELWVNPSRAQTVPLLQWNNNAGTEGVGVWQQNVGGTGVNIALTDSSGTGHDIGVNADVLPRNAWTHLAVTYDKVTGLGRIYLNGVLTTEQGMGVFTPRTNLPLFVGARVADNRYFQGALDEISFYTRPLSAGEVNAIYLAGAGGKNPPDDNLSPVVNAGPDVQVFSAMGTATLGGSVSDDGKPADGTLTSTWSRVDGPGAVTFASAATPATTATFGAPGTYVLRLDASDGFNQATGDTMVVQVGLTGVVEADSSLAAWWAGNGDAREAVHGHDIERMQGMAFGTGQVSQAFALDGVNDHGRVPQHNDLNIGTSAAGLTIELWVNPSRTQFAPLLQWNAFGGAEGVGLWQQNNGNTGVNAALTDTNGTGHDIGINADVLPRNAWTHVAVTYDKATGWGRVYINGVLLTEQSMGIFTPRTNLPLVIGARVADNRYFQGMLDEISLYTRPLSLAEINAIYQAGAAGKNPVDDNLPPVLSAGPDVQLSGGTSVAALNGSVVDDGKPVGGTLTSTWSKVEGPGTVTFADSSAATTTATLGAPGTYVLRLDANDGFNQAIGDTMTVRAGVPASVEGDAALVAWWPANGESHEVVRGNHDVERYNGMGFGPGKVAQTFVLDGVNDYGRVPAHADLNIGASTAGLTIELWVNPSRTQFAPLLQWNAFGGAEGVGLWQQNNGNTGVNAALTDTSGTGHDIGINADVLPRNAWTHVAVTYDKATGWGRVYINGVIMTEQSMGIFTPRTNLPLVIGARVADGRYFQGGLDEIGLYNRPLTYAEVNAIYQSGSVGKNPIDDNQSPAVSAGPDVAVADTGTSATLAGTALDDGRPFGAALAPNWFKADGPGTVTFGNPNAAATTATFSTAGTYVLRLEGSDGFNQARGDATVVRVGVTGMPGTDAALVAWWPGNGEPTEVAHGHDVELLQGMGYGLGKVAQAFALDGVNDHGRVPAHADFNIGTSVAGLTIEFWVNPSRTQLAPFVQWNNNAGVEGVGVWQQNNGNTGVNAALTDTSGTGHDIGINADVLPRNAWTHVAVTYDRTTGQAQIYINGASQASQNLGIFTPRTNLPLFIGARLGDSRFFQGGLDEIGLYTRPLTAPEINAIFVAGAAGKAPLAVNVRPTIVFASPPSGSAMVVNTPVTLSALATDADGSVAKVEFYDGATKLGETLAADVGQPTSFTFALGAGFAALGRHELTARVTDNSGAVVTSGLVVIDVAPVLPVIALTSPVSNASVPAGVAVTLEASATYSLGALARVEFYDGAAKLGESTSPSSGSTYSLVVPAGFGGGTHTLTAKAIAVDTATATSVPVTITATVVVPAIALTVPAANSTLFSGAAVTFKASATYAAGPITKVEFYDGATKVGEATSVDPDTTSTYSYVAAAGLSLGTHSLSAKVLAANGAVAVSPAVPVNVVLAAPVIALTSPVNNSNVVTGVPLTLVATATQAVGTIVKVEFFDGVTKLGEKTTADAGDPASYTFVANAGLTGGTHTLRAKATASNTATTTSAPVFVTAVTYNGAPVAEISAPVEDGRLTAPTTVTGVVAHSALASWALDYRLKATEGAPDEPWVLLSTGSNLVGTPANGSNPAVPGTLGTFDPTLLINGIYELRLSVTNTSAGTLIAGPITVVVEGDMKVGAFALAFEDLKVPVDGIPIKLSRSYDSRDTRVGDFGPGWRLALANIRVQKNRNLGAGWYQTPQSGSGIQFYNVDPVGDRIVTAVFPDGEMHRFKIGANVKVRPGDPDNASFAVVVTEGQLKFYPIGDTTSNLEPLDSNNQLADHFFIGGTGDQDITAEDAGSNPFASPYNTTRYRLTTKDGTAYILDEALGLLSMADLNGNTLVVGRDALNRVASIVSQQAPPAPNSQAPSPTTVVVHRDGSGRVDYIRDPAGRDLDYLYDAQGRLASFTNRELNVTQFRYENASFPYYLTKIIDPRGVTAIRSEFDAGGRMIKQIDADGKETVFTHQLGGALRFDKIKDRLGNETTLYYDDRGNVVTKVDALGAQTNYNYVPDTEWVRFETDHYGNIKSTAFDARGNVLVETIGANSAEDPATPTTGHSTRTLYNSRSAPTRITDPDGRVQTFAYDPVTNNLLTHTVGADPNNAAIGDRTTYTYNADGTPATITDSLGMVMHHAYDNAYSNPAYPGVVKRLTITLRDPAGTAGSDPTNLTDTILSATQALQDVQENNLVQIVTRHLPDGTAEEVVTRCFYDAENRLVATVMPDGRVNETRYNVFGQTEKIALWRTLSDYQAHNDSLARITSYGYDNRGNQTSLTYADNTSEVMHFDEENRKDWSQDRRGNKTYFQYDAVGRLRFTIFPDATPATLADNPRTETGYDLAGRVTDTYDEVRHHTHVVYFDDGSPDASLRRQTVQKRSLGDLLTTYQYDQSGNIRFVTDPRGNVVETRYDNRDRAIMVLYPATDENPATQTVTVYDALDRRIEFTDQDGKVTRNRYDGLGHLIERRQYLDQSLAGTDSDFHLTSSSPGVVITRYAYDELGNQRAQTDALGRTTTFWTDSLGRRTKRVLPKDSTESAFLTETLQYDEWGNLWQRTDYAGKTTTFGYDALNRLKSKTADLTHPSLAYSHAIARIEYDYDANGARTAARTYNAGNTQLYSESTPRDERGRLDYKDTAAGRLDYSYYANNLLKDTVSSSNGGLNVGYRYDETNRLESVDDSSGTASGAIVRTTGYTYNANGSLETLAQPNAVVHTYSYDALNRLRGLGVSRGATLLHTYEYKLKPSGHRRQVVENSARTAIYSYDDLDRLTGESVIGDMNNNNGEVRYDLDKVGNRTSRNSSMPSVASLVNQSFNARDWLDGNTYTANGSTIQGGTVVSPVGSTTDVYDFEEHLIVRTKSDGSTINLGYDADGNRIQKNLLDAAANPGPSTSWLVDTNNHTGHAQVVEERVTTGGVTPSSLVRVYTYGSSLISQASSLNAQPATLSYFTRDGQGSVRELTDTNGSVTDRFDYDAFGNLIFRTGASLNAYLYAGEQYDGDLGLYYLRARYLNPDSGRFWSMDDFEGDTEDPVSLHKYLYASANPVRFCDPSGHQSMSVSELGAVGAVIGLTVALALPSTQRLAADAGNAALGLAGEAGQSALGKAQAAYAATVGAAITMTFSVRDEIAKAREELRRLGRKLKFPKIMPVPKPWIPKVGKHVQDALAKGKPFILTRTSPAIAKVNRRAALKGLGFPGLLQSWDEYPFASSTAGGFGASTRSVPLIQNRTQGGIIRAVYALEKIKVGDSYIVIVIP